MQQTVIGDKVVGKDRREVRVFVVLLVVIVVMMMMVWWASNDIPLHYRYLHSLPAITIPPALTTRSTLTPHPASTTRPTIIPPPTLLIPPTLARHCHTYTGLTAHNTCCQTLDYRVNNSYRILQCFMTAIASSRHSRENNVSITEGKAAARTGAWAWIEEDNGSEVSEEVHWVMVGDSHIRYIFYSLLQRFPNGKLEYRLSEFPKREWHHIQELYQTTRQIIGHQTVQVRHVDLFFHLTFEWDPFLLSLPSTIHRWLKRGNPPAFLLTGTALHWIRNTIEVYKNHGVEAAAYIYRRYLATLTPVLTSLTSHTKVVFKLLDHIAGLNNENHHPKNLEVYNRVTREVFNGSGVAVWDATIPLSEAYVARCKKIPLNSPNRWWACDDKTHVGFVVLQEYVEMLLNHMCTALLDPASLCH